MLIAVLFLQEAIKDMLSEFTIPKGEGRNQPKYQFEWLYTNGLVGNLFSLGVLSTSLKSRRARAWRYGTGFVPYRVFTDPFEIYAAKERQHQVMQVGLEA
ncbi:hypothetical protein HPP92_023775 [Vanilla planifolia]|uniref:Uncharacterized protein n=1 Tax=Vanilla planifolia TaxID=51239 RepID=A0A835PQY3_VANPL|nr:hypothetical protein HPP92_023775 [Vanilla planifolia]